MSGDRTETALVALVLLSAACVLAAPVVGRQGAPGLANLLMATAAGCGVVAFGVAGVVTVRAARRAGRDTASHGPGTSHEPHGPHRSEDES